MFAQSLYCDVRQLLSYIKEVHGGTFRRVLLSGLLDATSRTQQRSVDSPQDTGHHYRCPSMTIQFDRISFFPIVSIRCRRHRWHSHKSITFYFSVLVTVVFDKMMSLDRLVLAEVALGSSFYRNIYS